MSRTNLSISLVAALAFACGGKPAATTDTTDTSTAEPAPPAESSPADAPQPADMAFEDMTHEQRVAFMKNTVVPTMKSTFQQFDAKRFGEFNCKTCHGSGATDGTFKMPSPDLPRLPPPEKFMDFAKDPAHAPWVEFMAQKVKPQMALLLKEKEFDPATNTGEFSCHACHMTVGE